MSDVYEYLKPALPMDHTRQSRATDLVQEVADAGWAPKKILDLGCGTGSSIDFFKKVFPASEWVGVDIEFSPEVSQRTRKDATFVTFDGINIPFDEGSFDLVFSNQSFEHVRHPEALLKEVQRVLSPTGLLIGQTSHLEPYHSYSYWSFTVWGWKRICQDAGIEIVKFRPGIDGLTLTERSYKGRPDTYTKWFATESPYNTAIEENAVKEGKSRAVINFRKLMMCGQFAFTGRKMV
ncbi:class I SAM-dependent methyltransferase [Ensifer adhaerens]|uniref:class I SAM-dependent methyltransferase n=1 Tax=Ensifer adhaerens TaxID=106592 RepID=UPI00385126F5